MRYVAIAALLLAFSTDADARHPGRPTYEAFTACVKGAGLSLTSPTKLEVSDGAVYSGVFAEAKGGYALQVNQSSKMIQASVLLSGAAMADEANMRTLIAVFVTMGRCLTSDETDEALGGRLATEGRASTPHGRYTTKSMGTGLVLAVEYRK